MGQVATVLLTLLMSSDVVRDFVSVYVGEEAVYGLLFGVVATVAAAVRNRVSPVE